MLFFNNDNDFHSEENSTRPKDDSLFFLVISFVCMIICLIMIFSVQK